MTPCGEAFPRRNRRRKRVTVVRVHHGGFLSGVDPLRLNQLNDSLEAAGFAGSPLSRDVPTLG